MNTVVKAYLIYELVDSEIDHVNRQKIDSIINEIFQDSSNTDAIRLGYCIAIDILNNLVEASHYREILSSDFCNPNILANCDICQRFHHALKNYSLFQKPSKHSGPKEEKINIVTIIEAVSFLKYYGDQLTPRRKFSNKTDFDIFISEIKNTPLVLTIKDWPDGVNKKYFWVMPHDDLSALIKEGKETMDMLNSIGVTATYQQMTEKHFLICCYPQDFRDSNDLFQPNSTNAAWKGKNGLYLSYIEKDAWGRTFPTKGIIKYDEEKRERIHLKIDQVQVEILYLGEITEALEAQTETIIPRAKQRFSRKNC